VPNLSHILSGERWAIPELVKLADNVGIDNPGTFYSSPLSVSEC
jgi:hypothetical protein